MRVRVALIAVLMVSGAVANVDDDLDLDGNALRVACPDPSYTLTTQAEVDNFPANCNRAACAA